MEVIQGNAAYCHFDGSEPAHTVGSSFIFRRDMVYFTYGKERDLTNDTESVIAELRSENEELKRQNAWLEEQLRLYRKKLFGSKSEKASEEVMEQLSFLFDEAEVIAAEEQKPAAPVVEVRAHERKKSGSVKDIVPEDIPVETVEHGLSEEERVCPQCGEEMQVIGKEVKKTLVFKPAEAYLRSDIYYT